MPDLWVSLTKRRTQNQYLDQRLRPFVNYHQDNWSDLLPCMDWAQATLPHETTGLSPYEVEFGHRLWERTP